MSDVVLTVVSVVGFVVIVAAIAVAGLRAGE